MNRNYSGHSDRDENSGYKTHRSERYRHPESSSNYRFDDYGSPARGGYGNESQGGTWGNQGNEMGGSRNVTDRGQHDTYGSSRNYGNMGSYGGAQGFGSSRGGYTSQRERGHDYDSGMSNRPSGRDTYGQRSHGYESDYDSHGSTFRNDRNPNLYGSDTSRRFQGSDQGRYDFDRDNYNQGSGYSSGSQSNYGRSQGNYMGSGYNRSSNSDYDTGNYGSMGSYDRGSSNLGYGTYDAGSSWSGRNRSYPNNTYARDLENPRIQHKDSDYSYNPNRAFDTSKDRDYINSHNQARTWDQEHDRHRNMDRY